MSIAEKYLLVAACDRLRSIGNWSDQDCEIEFDSDVPSIAGDTYIAVTPGGWSSGPRNNTSGGVSDLVYSIDVTAIKRTRNVPRDRRRDVFLNNVAALDAILEIVHYAIDWKYEVINAASLLIASDTDIKSKEPFIEPLRFASIERKPRLVSPDTFGSGQTQAAGMARTITFGGARRITTISR